MKSDVHFYILIQSKISSSNMGTRDDAEKKLKLFCLALQVDGVVKRTEGEAPELNVCLFDPTTVITQIIIYPISYYQ